MSEQSLNTVLNDEISIKDIINFLIEAWKIIFLTSLFGIVGSTVYLWVAPNQYQSTAQISVNNNNANPLGISIEYPNLLMIRLKLSITYLSEEILRLNTFIASADKR
jgi:uncharacterized protein involved in exopolysaccharide biosynthesis